MIALFNNWDTASVVGMVGFIVICLVLLVVIMAYFRGRTNRRDWWRSPILAIIIIVLVGFAGFISTAMYDIINDDASRDNDMRILVQHMESISSQAGWDFIVHDDDEDEVRVRYTNGCVLTFDVWEYAGENSQLALGGSSINGSPDFIAIVGHDICSRHGNE